MYGVRGLGITWDVKGTGIKDGGNERFYLEKKN